MFFKFYYLLHVLNYLHQYVFMMLILFSFFFILKNILIQLINVFYQYQVVLKSYNNNYNLKLFIRFLFIYDLVNKHHD